MSPEVEYVCIHICVIFFVFGIVHTANTKKEKKSCRPKGNMCVLTSVSSFFLRGTVHTAKKSCRMKERGVWRTWPKAAMNTPQVFFCSYRHVHNVILRLCVTTHKCVDIKWGGRDGRYDHKTVFFSLNIYIYVYMYIYIWYRHVYMSVSQSFFVYMSVLHVCDTDMSTCVRLWVQTHLRVYRMWGVLDILDHFFSKFALTNTRMCTCLYHKKRNWKKTEKNVRVRISGVLGGCYETPPFTFMFSYWYWHVCTGTFVCTKSYLYDVRGTWSKATLNTPTVFLVFIQIGMNVHMCLHEFMC